MLLEAQELLTIVGLSGLTRSGIETRRRPAKFSLECLRKTGRRRIADVGRDIRYALSPAQFFDREHQTQSVAPGLVCESGVRDKSS